MDVATLSLGALAIAIIVSCTIRLHVGFLAIALAWVVGVYIAGMSANDVMAGFPTRLFLTLAGVTLLFSQAQANGTLDLIAHRAVRLCRGNVGVMPMMFFLLSFVLASIGPGNISSTALMAPMGMAVAGQVGIPAFLMAIMIGNGANAGSLSPIAPTGVIVNGVMADIGLGGNELQTYLNNMMAHIVIAFAAYFLLGGWRLLGRRHHGELVVPGGSSTDAGASADAEGSGSDGSEAADDDGDTFQRRHWITIGVIGALLVGVIFFNLHVGLGAFAGAILLALFKAGDENEAVKLMPWRVIMMVCGVTVLISVLDETGGLELFTRVLAGVSSANTVTGIMAFTTGFISIYSSTSGVVLPAFLPTVPGLAEQVGGVTPLAIASAMNVGAHLVDVSALSTLGALCMAAAPSHEDSRKLFNKLMAWGLSMTIVGGFTCWLLFTVLRIGIN
ncbi:MAG: C4-dicarboxylate ABC transporter [Acidobacteria bacterium]|nr:C4-dicarboxylate ABC transporter [Acidobacteriota bacterium]MYJ04805.1 C4-dicarboxylate ABC transporter [Acidobacteriota bacterium]